LRFNVVPALNCAANSPMRRSTRPRTCAIQAPVIGSYWNFWLDRGELLFHTAAYRAIFAGRSNGMTIGLQNLSNQNFYNVRTLLPPVEEQREIVAFATAATRAQDAAIRVAEREISLIREYRTRLIADVGTGQVDVRGLAPSAADADAVEEVDDEPDDPDLEAETTTASEEGSDD
jgi:hypothetical protein